MATKKEYGNQSISSLKGAERVRKRPGVIFGSDGLDGCQHAFFEILSNAIDEAREGYGKQIDIRRYSDGSFEVEDRGRGCPLDWNEAEQRYNWELVFCELYAGGKYNNESEENYGFSLGLNGLGSCATQYASRYMDVTVLRDGFEYSLHFERGDIVGKLEKKPTTSKRTGTTIRWLPDLDVFTSIDIPDEYFDSVLRRQAVANAGLNFILHTQQGSSWKTQEYKYENGIVDYAAELAGEDALTSVCFWQDEAKGRDREDKADYKVRLSVAFCFSNKVNIVEHYHNSSWLEYGGSPDKATRNAFVYAIDNYLKQNSKYQKSESRITYADVQESLILVSNNFSTQTSYENQTKKAVTSRFVQEAMTNFLRANLEAYLIENRMDAEKIAEQILVNKRARENAERTRLNMRKKLSGNLDISNRVEKFVDCRTKDVTRRELYIVEGDSAMGACKQGRDAEFQGIMPIRGKILNCLKADYSRIFASDVITDLLKVLGCGVEISGKEKKDLASFDIQNLRWSKIIICTDADEDGYQIRTLILTMLYRLVPTLIREGLVFIAESPLYEINCKDKTLFAYSEGEKNAILAGLEGSKYSISRSKGLGENEPDMMRLTTMSPMTRRLIKVLPEEAHRMAEVFDLLLGENLEGRKEHIANEGYKYLELADIS